LGKLIVNKKNGAVVTVNAPAGKVEYKIVGIK